jgi:hypothetical protein
VVDWEKPLKQESSAIMTYIIMDIDGVLNPFGARHNTQLGFTWFEKNNTGVFLKPDMHVKWLEELSKDATFVWGSAWAAGSNLLLELLDLNTTWNWIPLDEEDVGWGTWKIKSIRRWVEANADPAEKIVWLDDELEEDAFAWAEARGNMLAICPNRYEGLTEEHFKQIHSFVTT